MEKWMSKGRRSPLKADVDFPKNRNKNFERATSPDKKKSKKWTFGNFLRRKSKDPPVYSISTQTIEVNEPDDTNIYAKIEIKTEPTRIEPQITKNDRIIACNSSSEDSLTSQDLNLPQSPEFLGRNGRKNRLKARIQAKREKYKGNSSSDDENPSSLSLLRIHSADSIQNSPKSESYTNKRCRGARTERYMKRLYTNGENRPSDQNLMKSQLKYPSDILPNRNHSLFGSDYNISSRIDKIPAKVSVEPPEPPPRSFKLHIYPKTMRYSLQNSDIENDQNRTFKNRQTNINCNSLDRMYTCQVRNFNNHKNPVDILPKNRSSSPSKNVSWCRELEKPIIPKFPTELSNNINNTGFKCSDEDRKRHSKNLEEALEELETIYNSLRLNDEDLLDRAEQRSMDEYRDKIATSGIEGSIKSTDSSSSNEIMREVVWRDVGLRNYENEVCLKDDMAYRRMHQNERPLSVDNYGSVSRMSYLTSSPCLSYKEMDYERPRSRRGTPDLTRDDVAFRSICHANNTLKILDPQPPFGIPIGPVSCAAESDYLHVEPNKENHCRSLYIPKNEPDIVTDDLAFRSLRKDSTMNRSQSPGNMSFLPKTLFTPEIKKKRAVRSLSADLYGIINKDSKQSSWYKKYVKLNRPLRISGILEASGNEINKSHLDINGNKPKTSNYKGRIQVHVPQNNQKKSIKVEVNCNEENLPIPNNNGAIPSFTDHELLEYKELCRELENLIKKTSETVKNANKIDSRRNSLTEFVKWEELLGNNNLIDDDEAKEEPLGTNDDDDNNNTEKDELDVNLDKSIASEVNAPSLPSTSEKTTEPIFSSSENLKDGSSCNEATCNIKETFELKMNNNDRINDILMTSKDIELSSDCHDEINIATLNEGEKMDNEYNAKLNGHLLKSIMNVCFVTNCLTAYSVALWSLCLTLLIAIIVAL